jgi:hypothetical protein
MRAARGASLKDLVNEALRRGLLDISAPPRRGAKRSGRGRFIWASRSSASTTLLKRSLTWKAKASTDPVDVNLLIYASNAKSAQHDDSRDWLDGQLSPVHVGSKSSIRIGSLRIRLPVAL